MIGDDRPEMEVRAALWAKHFAGQEAEIKRMHAELKAERLKEYAMIATAPKNIRTELTPIGDWYAIDADEYDGAPDAGRAGTMGWGKTEAEAIADLIERLDEAE